LTDLSYDVVVVGAGPAGSMAARYAARSGAKTLIIEEHTSAGSPLQCTGLISSKTIDECEIKQGPWIYQSIKGAHIFPPNNTCISIGGEKIRAYVIDRKIFDRTLLEHSIDEGANIMMKTKALGLQDHHDKKMLHLIHNGCKCNVTAKVVIGADGVQSNIARWSGLGQVRKVLSGVQIETGYDVMDTNMVDVFVGNNSPGFFAWSVPVSKDIARIGLCVDPSKTQLSAYEHLCRFMQTNLTIRERARPGCLDMVVGCIPLGPQPCTAANGVVITGDAAGQVKSTSGGGVYMGAICAKHAGEVAANAALSGNTSAQALMEYDRRWREAVGRELSMGMRMHNVLGRLNNDDLNELMGFFNEPGIIEIINQYGDIDHPSILLGKLITKARGKSVLKVTKVLLRMLIG